MYSLNLHQNITDLATSAGILLVIFLSANTISSANPVDKSPIELEHEIDGHNDALGVDKRGSFSDVLRDAGSSEEDAYNRILRGASFSRILRSSPTTSGIGSSEEDEYNRILRGASFSRILRSPTSSFSRILRARPGAYRFVRPNRGFSRIVRGKPSQFSRILREPQGNALDETSYPRQGRAYSRILRSDPNMAMSPASLALPYLYERYANNADVDKRASSGFSRILRDSYSRIL